MVHANIKTHDPKKRNKKVSAAAAETLSERTMFLYPAKGEQPKAEWEQHKLQHNTLAAEVQEINRFLDNVDAATPTFCGVQYPNYAALCTSLASMTAQDLIDGWSNGSCAKQ